MKFNGQLLVHGELTMRRYTILLAVFALFAVSWAIAQAPAGWMARIDRSASATKVEALDAIKFVTMGTGFHATNAARAAAYWNPANTATGTYTIKGTFKLMKPAGGGEFYGLFFGGSDLEGPNQSYIYFLVCEEGSFLVKRRIAEKAETVMAETPHKAINKAGTDGTSVNALEVRVLPDKIDYVANGITVYTTPKTGLTDKTDGIYGIRVNHGLEVQIDQFGIAKK